ncbi:MAG: 2Fe-2S iron-sulfur cluster-binding protein [SAR324 cluster bacterium]|nr:2Fe-2S iron-sulfur cluster-binding protein [SAR324 cluster bacterium]MCZ6557328.1 2Fe-2S iron-sulfur cluster-binding protein [SAR324 cluster bacterium]MCZ6627470.1 2Fe-2S iron-sulfur cluster-binding protein [SAR324 cluster bacterium]
MKALLHITVNGIARQEAVAGNLLLIEFLRDNLGLTGTKMGCDGGDCGACTVLVDGRATLSCLTLAATLEGSQVTSVEGLAAEGVLDAIQEGFHVRLGSQCGFCTPGMIMAARSLLDANPQPSVEEIKAGLSNNLCRCTGYNTIVESVQFAIEKMREAGG